MARGSVVLAATMFVGWFARGLWLVGVDGLPPSPAASRGLVWLAASGAQAGLTGAIPVLDRG